MKRTSVYVAGLVAITAVHLVYRQMQEPRPTEVSTRTAPFEIGELGLERVDVEPDWGPCQLLIFFRPTCPFCDLAAKAESGRSDLTLPRTWITETEAEAMDFVGRPAPSSELGWGLAADDILGVQAVPAAFLVSDGQVLRHWTYQGTESDTGLASDCEA